MALCEATTNTFEIERGGRILVAKRPEELSRGMLFAELSAFNNAADPRLEI